MILEPCHHINGAVAEVSDLGVEAFGIVPSNIVTQMMLRMTGPVSRSQLVMLELC